MPRGSELCSILKEWILKFSKLISSPSATALNSRKGDLCSNKYCKVSGGPYTKEFGGFGPFVKVQNLRILHELSKVSKRLTVINIRTLNLTCRSYAIKIVDTVRV